MIVVLWRNNPNKGKPKGPEINLRVPFCRKFYIDW